MSIATVHYLSMNTPSGRLTEPEPEYGGVSYSFSVDSLTPSLSHTIAWGDTNTDVQSTNGSGVLTKSHTYATEGKFKIVVTETASGRKVAQKTVTIRFKTGTLVVPSYIEDVAANLSGSGFNPSGSFSIDWGDLSSATTGTFDGSGNLSNTAHTYALYGSYTITVTIAGTTVATGTATVGHNDGTVTFGGAVTNNVAAHLTGSSLAFSRSYDIDWGDGTGHATVSTDGAGALPSTAHTYTVAATYNVVVKDGAHTSATLSQVVG